MKIRLKCTCGKVFPIDAEQKGKRFRCPSCGEPLVADAEPDEEKSESQPNPDIAYVISSLPLREIPHSAMH